MEFTKGFAVVARRHHGDVLRSFATDESEAKQRMRQMLDAAPLRTIPAEICFAANGNVRQWNAERSQ